MFKFFIDDSGSKDYKNPYDKSLSDSLYPWSSTTKSWLDDNFFVLCGIYIHTDNMKIIDNEIKALKKRIFGTEYIEIKSVYLRNPKLRKRYYLDKYPVTEQSLKDFWDSLFTIISKYQNTLKLITTIFDKRHYKNRSDSDKQPLLKSVQAIFERIEHIGNDTHIVFDQMESSLSLEKGNHKWICNVAKGNVWLSHSYIEDYTHIKKIEFQKSHNDNFLQIADICSYVIRRQFMEHWKVWLEGWSDCGVYDYFDKIRCNVYTQFGKSVWYGLIIIPNFKKIQWNISIGCDTQKNSTN